MEDDVEFVELVKKLFYDGFKYHTIVNLLKKFMGVDISVRTLKRYFQKLNLRRKGLNFDENRVRRLISEITQEPTGMLRGYRAVWQILRSVYHIQIPRISVEILLREIDPQSSCMRQSRRLNRRRYNSHGPNFVWHVDGKASSVVLSLWTSLLILY